MSNLASLDISRNPLKDLPPEMGRLTNCWDLKLQDLNIQNRQLRDVIQGNRAQEIIGHLRDQLRRVESTYILKTIVLGPPGKGKSTVIRTLAPNCGNTFCDTIIPTTVSTFKESKVKIEGRKDKPKVTLRIWELPGTLELMAMHPVLWTENCLFLLVWDMAAGINHLDHWLCGIKARLEKASVIIVGTMCDRIQPSDVLRRKEQFLQDINKMYEQGDKNFDVFPKDDHRGIYPHLSDVVLVGLGSTQGMRQGTQQLRSAVYLSALSFIKNPSIREYIVGQKLPQSYLKIDEVLNQKHAERLMNNQPPFLTKTEFDELINTVPDTDFHTFDDLQEAVTVWCQMGSLLHYDVWTEGLCNLYFLDPDWLVRMIAAVLLPSRNTPPHRQTLSTVQQTLTNKGLPEDILKAFLQLLKHFDIGAEITEQDQNILLLPCRLPREAPGLQLHRQQYERKLLRFYSLPHVPARLWSRLILGLLLSKERFSQSRWFLGARPHEEEGSDKTLHSSRHGFRMQRLHMMYWQTGLSMTFDGGSVVMETCVYRVEGREIPGILIFISSITRSLSNLAVVGFVSDELYAAIQNIFPHHCEDPEVMNVFALCPVCHDSVEPGQGTIEGTMLHFELHKCAAALLQGDFALCHTGCRVALEELVPEFLFTELPRKFHLHIEDIQVSSTKLGGGAVGSVFKGKLGDKDTAVKVFYSNELPTGSPAGDSGVSSVSSGGSQTSTGQPAVDVVNPPASPTVESTEVHEERPVSDIVYGNFAKQEELFNWLMEDRNESRSLKICRAFSELRQEVAILSKLRHPCIVALYGVCVRPSLLVALELAPLGSLRSVLKANVSLRPPFNKYTDRDKIFCSVLHKNITFKIIYQVANGLHYLHKNKVLYRDLKSDNVLICSLDPSDDINVKISDYGISKFATPQGMMGMVGTPGYMAPEIMYGQAYDEKVDIFSFAMVIYETLTGHQPFESYPRLHQLNQIINFERRRPSLKEYNVVPCFPYLESLMHEMWEHEPNKRPSAVDVMKRMQDVSFLLQCAYIKDPEESLSRKSLFPTDNLASCIFCNITCAWASQEPSIIKNRNTCWIWEFPTKDTGDRRLSVYNLASNQFHIHRKTSPGHPVTCMTKVGSCMWVGVQAKYIEIFGNSCTDIPRCQNQLGKLQAEPRCIIHDKHNPKKSLADGEGFVYVGLSDGTIAIYEHYRWHRNDFTHEWKLRKELTLRTTQPVSAMCLVPNLSKHELWVACGHALFVVSSDNFLVAEKLCVKKELSTSAEMVSSIACIVKAEDSLWCSFKGSPLIVEFSISQKMVLCALCLEADIIEEISIEKIKLHRTSDCQECIEERGHRQPVQHGKPGTSEDPTELPPPRPPRSTILSSTLTSGVEEDPPQVPPRRGRSKSENHTLGFARELSPPIPPRRTLPPEHHKVHVQSLLIIRGMLWVGTSKGEVILINTKDLSKSQDTANTSYSHPADRAAETSSRPEDTVRTSVNTDCGQICSLKPIMLTTARALNPDSQSGSVHFLLQAQNLVVAVHNMGCDGDGLNEVTMWEECSYEQITEIRQYWQSLRVLKARVEQADSLDVLKNR
ncbi:leucine-rich repeat serine/threonine-protein kinase 1-like isoform X3 [Pomacea canaliculata]|uniref:leucine-rich repeat serine/threonine-protein kinase 1-like isoform X3 n=1 Tax=Pomacea canaliculata TaxID=400727 RepID=UPI000D726510|nr:leucine-rich repeat serine/threonine-protein kinase 1-like isoform X3 [Pomacea canaliculata]